MPTFRVKGPDGRTFKVNAPEGTTRAQAIAYAQKKFASKPRTALQTGKDFILDTVDNVIPNWGDEIYGRGQQLGAKLGVNDRNPDTAYEDAKADFKRDQAQYDREHPGLAWTSTIAGSVAGPGKIMLPLKGAKAAATALRAAPKVSKKVRAARAAGTGAGIGAVAGAGQEEGDGRIANAVTGAGIGATVGAVLPSALDGAQAAGRFARTNVPGIDPAINAIGNAGRRIVGLPAAPPTARASAQADSMLADRMGQGDIVRGPGQPGPASSPAAIADEVQRRADMNVPAMPADTTEAMRKLTGWAGRGTGPGQTAVREAITARKATEGARVRNHIGETLGPAVDPIKAVEDSLAASKLAAKPLYEEAYELPTRITPEMAKIMETPAFQEAVPNAVRNIQNDMGDPRTMGFIPQPDGSFISPAEGVLTTQGFDQVVRAMRKSANDAGDTNALTGRVTHNTNSAPISARAGELQRELTEQNPPLRQAIEGYADEAAHRQAIEAGGGVAKQTGHEINALARSLPDDARPSYAIGARTALADQASTFGAKTPMGDTAQAVTKSLGDPTKQAAIETMDGSRGAVPALQQRLEAEHQGNIVAKEVLGGPGTAEKLGIDGEINGEAAARFTSLQPMSVIRDTLSFISEKAATPYRNAVKERIAQVVTETNPATVKELMAEIAARAAKDADFADLMRKSGLAAAYAYGSNIQPDLDQ